MIVLSGCTGEEDNCQLGSRAASVPRGWLVCVWGIRRVSRPPALWSQRGAGARMPIPVDGVSRHGLVSTPTGARVARCDEDVESKQT